MLRRVDQRQLTLTLVTSASAAIHWQLVPGDGEGIDTDPGERSRVMRLGRHCFLHLLSVELSEPLPADQVIEYDLWVAPESGEPRSWREWAPDLAFPGRARPGFVIRERVGRILHGSCRKPHHDSGDGLVRTANWLGERLDSPGEWPAALVMSGDQIYADDVAGPMLGAAHQLVARLGLPNELLEGATVSDSEALYSDHATYYRRERLLPTSRVNRRLREIFFGGARKPIFTADNAHNHLITLGEVIAMYLLVWSPAAWEGIDLSPPPWLDDEQRAHWQEEQPIIEAFRDGLPDVRRLLAHLPVAMMFDDHDITDDWNLNIGWEQAAYGHPFSRRIIGNALIGYCLFQGWGNAPERFSSDLLDEVQEALDSPGTPAHGDVLDRLLAFDRWHYQWPTDPPLLVLDTRTHRWRSERGVDRPSGLMDWEALTDLQSEILDRDAVILVSPAPMFGVKLIEAIQQVFTWLGKPLLVDAENWMAHPGAAYALMNLFRHPRTPRHFVILSGDVHYSFVYDVELRGRERGPDIWQVTSSGFRNEFPPGLLEVLDRLNRWLYAPWSPLNWFTKRRGMRVIPRKPTPASAGERLVNAAGVGLVDLDAQGRPIRVEQLAADGRDVRFELHEAEARWE